MNSNEIKIAFVELRKHVCRGHESHKNELAEKEQIIRNTEGFR